MRKLIFMLALFLSISAIGQVDKPAALSEEQKKLVIETVNIWITELFKAEDTDKLMQVSDIPFAWDRVVVLNSKDELKKLYLEVFEDNGKRAVPKFDIKISEYKSEILRPCIPLNFAMVIIAVRKESGEINGKITVCVLIKENDYKVVGFSD